MESNVQPAPDHTPGQPANDGSGIWSIIVGVFTSPSKAFADYTRNPRIVVPLVLVIVLAVIGAVLTAKYNAQLQYDMMKTSRTIPAEALNQMKEGVENPNLITSALGTTFGVTLVTVVEALVAWFLGAFVFGGESRFKAIWGVGLLIALIPQVGNMLRIPLVYAKDTMLVSYGLAALMPDKDFTSLLYMFLYFADAFMIWGVIAGGYGYSSVFGISKGKGMALSILIGLLFILVIIGFTVLGLSFAGVEFSWI